MVIAKSRNRSIKDFFAQRPARETPQLQGTRTGPFSSRRDQHSNSILDASSASPTPVVPLTDSSLHRDPPHPTQTVPAAASISDSVPVPPAPTTATATSPDAQPPPTSQTSVNSGASKRIISNGEQMVLNSDSDDSLPELDWGPLTSNVKTLDPVIRSKNLTTNVDDDDGLRRPERRSKSKKRPFDHVVETAQNNKKLERIITEHKADLYKDVEQSPAGGFVFTEDALDQAVQDDDDPDKAHRLFLAMQRTNATQVETVFHFFSKPSALPAAKTKFPIDSLPACRWTSSLRDASTRDQAFLSGFALQVFRMQELPQELASWMIDQICLDRSEALDAKYLEVLEAHNECLRTLLSKDRLNDIFKAIGGNIETFASSDPLTPSFDAHSTHVLSLSRSLKSVVRLLGRTAPWLGTKARSHAFYILCHACMDDRIQADPDVLETVQDALEAIVCYFVDNQKLTQGLSDVLPRLLSRVTHPALQRDLVCAMPAKSPLTAYLRRHLALSFVLYPNIVDVPLSDPQLPALVHQHLETSTDFFINKQTDYSLLAARMTLLDIAIGPGLLTVPYRPLVSPAPSQAGSSPVLAPSPAPAEVKEFNKAVDALAKHIKILGNSVIEAGAVTDLTILDAKDCVERLCSRLEHAVRIGGKKMHDVFGDGDSEKQLKVTDHFRRAAKARKTVSTRGIFDDGEGDDEDRAVAAQIEAEIAA